MKNIFRFIVFLTPFLLTAQPENRVWPFGLSAGLVTFTGDTTVLDTIPCYDLYAECFAAICDPSGELVFIGSGQQLFLRDGRPMPSLDSLYRGRNCAENAFNRTQHMMALPYPGHADKYVVIYQSISNALYAYNGWQSTDELMYAVVDADFYGPGQPCLVSTQHMLYNEVMGCERITACQHANGRDWWIIARGYCNNRYIRFLLTPGGFLGPYTQHIGPAFCEPDHLSGNTFSKDGTLYAETMIDHPVLVMNFDRCSGLFSNPRELNVPVDTVGYAHDITMSTAASVAFSASGRYLYANNMWMIDQFDLQVPDLLPVTGATELIQASRQRVLLWDFAEYQPQGMYRMRLVPDNRIFIEPWHGVGHRSLHVIYHPDSGGLACDPRLFAFPVRANSATMVPNYPHFGLGPLAGSGCDSLQAVTDVGELVTAEEKIRVYPNPATGQVQATYPGEGEELEVVDMQGRCIVRMPCRGGKWQADVGDWSPGMYQLRIRSGATTWQTTFQVR